MNSKRFFSLDVLRGLAVAIMIIVDAPPAEIYPILKHAEWEGLTIADLAFPGFVFAMGISAAFSLSRHSISVKKILKRSALLFLIGILFNLLPSILALFLWEDFSSADFFAATTEHGSLFGILQRLALTYLLGMILIYFLQGDKKLFAAAYGLLIVSSLGFHLYAPENPFAIEKNISGAVDLIFPGANHIYTPNFDPEGLYGTFSSAALMLFGFLAGKILLRDISLQKKIYFLSAMGVIFLCGGVLWSFTDIISKNLWTAPFSLLTASFEIFLSAGFLKLFDAKKSAEKIFQPLGVLGKNPLFFFLASNFWLVFFFTIKIENIPAWHWIFQHTIADFISTEFSSLIFCLARLTIWILCAEFLNRKNIVLKL